MIYIYLFTCFIVDSYQFFHQERVDGMPWHQSGANHYHAQFGHPDKGRAIKGLVVCCEYG